MTEPAQESPFVAHEALPGYAEAVTAWLADGTGTAAIPVWTGARRDLLDGIALARPVYAGRRTPEPAGTGVVVGASLPEEVRRLAGPLARTWVTKVEDLPDTGSVLVLGSYADLRADDVQDVVEQTYAQGRDLFLLTGRDAHTVSWVVAKQYADASPDGGIGVISELDALPAAPGTVWFGAEDVRHKDIQGIALDRVWRRMLFHGNGKDDQLNLGQFTLCGLSPVGERDPNLAGPKCAYGLGCTKPEEKLIPARRIRAAELVLANCFSGPLTDHAMYDPKYVILLDALDGPAQTVVATLTACDGARPENLAWLTESSGERNAARAINERLKDINPYPSFVQIGLWSGGVAERAEPAAGVEAAPVASAGVSAATDFPLHTVGARLSGLLDSGLLGEDYPLRPRLRQLSDGVLRYASRIVALSPQDGPPALAAIAEETKSLDLALAHRIAKHHDDAVLQFPTYFGERSLAEEPVDLDWLCNCGRPLRSYTRRGLVPVIADTVQGLCARCGDVVNSPVDGAELRVSAPDTVEAGTTLRVSITVAPHRAGTVNTGIVLPMYLNARARPALSRKEVRAGESARCDFEVEIAAEATPQAYYFTPYAVHDLGISTRRVHFTVSPSSPSSPPAPAGTGRSPGSPTA
ncbi:hypothetical protein ACGF0D_07865 [Kitasatospora sp. NPDC048298]|uniref:hypothetical protein n=1 Tax=Kitasatospora sp. NPDC048298 TaxID=3364049 RepID=UPI003714162D